MTKPDVARRKETERLARAFADMEFELYELLLAAKLTVKLTADDDPDIELIRFAMCELWKRCREIRERYFMRSEGVETIAELKAKAPVLVETLEEAVQ